jgi:hypothetical protein
MFGAAGSKDCWSNGVVQTHETPKAGSGIISQATVTLKGAGCHSRETRVTGGGYFATFKSPSGKEIGKKTLNFSTQTFTIECLSTGKTFTVGPGSTCPSYLPNGANCTAGTCP